MDCCVEDPGWKLFWDIDDSARFCRRFRRVGLQFPDCLLEDAPNVTRRLQVRRTLRLRCGIRRLAMAQRLALVPCSVNSTRS